LNEPIGSDAMMPIVKVSDGDETVTPALTGNIWRLSSSADDVSSVISPELQLPQPATADIARDLSLLFRNWLPLKGFDDVTADGMSDDTTPTEETVNDVIGHGVRSRLSRIDSEDAAGADTVADDDAAAASPPQLRPPPVWNNGRGGSDCGSSTSASRCRIHNRRQNRRDSLAVPLLDKEPVTYAASSDTECRDCWQSDMEGNPRRVVSAEGRRFTDGDIGRAIEQTTKFSRKKRNAAKQVSSHDAGGDRRLLSETDKKVDYCYSLQCKKQDQLQEFIRLLVIFSDSFRLLVRLLFD
jgi:hypothetical protein